MLSREFKKDKIVYKAWYRFTSDILNLESLATTAKKNEVKMLTGITHSVINVNGKLVPVPLCGCPLDICVQIGNIDGDKLLKDRNYINSIDAKLLRNISSVITFEIPSNTDLKVLKSIEDLIFRFGDPTWLVKSSPLNINASSYNSLEDQLEYLNDYNSLYNKLRRLKFEASKSDEKLKELLNGELTDDEIGVFENQSKNDFIEEYKKSIEKDYKNIEKEFSNIKSSNVFEK